MIVQFGAPDACQNADITMKTNQAKPAASPATAHDAHLDTMPPIGGVAIIPVLHDGPLLDKRGVATLLICSTRTVDTLMRLRQLPYLRITRRLVRFHRDDVLALLRERFSVNGGTTK